MEEVDEFTLGYFVSGTFMAPRFPFLVFRNLKTKLLGFGNESSIFPQISFHCCYNKKELRLWVPTWRWHTELFWVVAVLWLLFFSHSKSTMTDDADLRSLVHSLSMHSHQHCCIFRTPHSKHFFFLINNNTNQSLENSCLPFLLMSNYNSLLPCLGSSHDSM